MTAESPRTGTRDFDPPKRENGPTEAAEGRTVTIPTAVLGVLLGHLDVEHSYLHRLETEEGSESERILLELHDQLALTIAMVEADTTGLHTVSSMLHAATIRNEYRTRVIRRIFH